MDVDWEPITHLFNDGMYYGIVLNARTKSCYLNRVHFEWNLTQICKIMSFHSRELQAPIIITKIILLHKDTWPHITQKLFELSWDSVWSTLLSFRTLDYFLRDKEFPNQNLIENAVLELVDTKDSKFYL